MSDKTERLRAIDAEISQLKGRIEELEEQRFSVLGLPDKDIPIKSLQLSKQQTNALNRTGLKTVRDVIELLRHGEDYVLSIRNFGPKSLDCLMDALKRGGFDAYLA